MRKVDEKGGINFWKGALIYPSPPLSFFPSRSMFIPTPIKASVILAACLRDLFCSVSQGYNTHTSEHLRFKASCKRALYCFSLTV